MRRVVKLPAAVSTIYRSVQELSQQYPGRKFCPDGHLLGSIGEVVACETLGLTLSEKCHRLQDAEGNEVVLKVTSGQRVALYGPCPRLVVLRIVSSEWGEIVYDGPGQPVWDCCGKPTPNGQRVIRMSALRILAGGPFI